MQKIGTIRQGVFAGGGGKNFSLTPIFGPPEGLGAPKIVPHGGLEGPYLGSKFRTPPLKTGVRGLGKLFQKISKFQKRSLSERTVPAGMYIWR